MVKLISEVMILGEINNPHDKFLKETLSKKENAIGFIENYLPKDIVELIDLNKINIEKDSYITENLQEYFTDLLYKVMIKGEESYIYVLFEHKSYPDKLIGLQLLEYLIQCWKSKIKQKNKLPLVIPLVIYHGKVNWNIGVRFSDIIEKIDDKFKKYIPDFEYLLYDLSKYQDKDILGTEELKVMMQLMKYIYSENLTEKLKEIFKMFSYIEGKNLDYISTVTIYIMNTTEIEIKELAKIVTETISEKGGEIAMTTAQKLRKEGIEEGIEKEKIITAERLLAKQMSFEEVAEITELPIEKIKKIAVKTAG